MTRKRIIWTGIAVLLLGVPVACLWMWYSFHTGAAARVQALQDQGFPVSYEDLDRFYTIPSGAKNQTQEWVTVINTLDPLLKTEPVLKLSRTKAQVPAPGVFWSDEEACRQLVLENTKSELDQLRQLGREDGEVRFPIRYSSGPVAGIPRITQYRRVADLLSLDTGVQARNKQPQTTLDDILTQMQLARHIRREPGYLAFLAGKYVFERALRDIEAWLPWCDWTDEDLAVLQREVLKPDFHDVIRNSLTGERAGMLSVISLTQPKPVQGIMTIEYLRVYGELLESFAPGDDLFLLRQSRLIARLAALGRNRLSPLRYTDIPSLESHVRMTGNSVAESLANQRCVSILLAAQRYRLRSNRYPVNWQELQSPELWSVRFESKFTRNPSSGDTMTLEANESGITLRCLQPKPFREPGAVSVAQLPDIEYSLSLGPAAEKSGDRGE